MLRWVLLTPLCLFLLLILPLWLFFHDQGSSTEDEDLAPARVALDPTAQQVLAALAAPSWQGFPANIPWFPLDKLSIHHAADMEKLLREDPTTFLQKCLDRYDKEVQGYSCVMHKRERIGGKLFPLEIIDVHFRENPFSVFMSWRKGEKAARKVMYVAGENGDRLLARGAGWKANFGVWTKDLDGSEARNTERYLIRDFGMHIGMQHTHAAMLRAKQRNTLHVRFEGVYRVPEAGDRLCYKLVRTPYEPPEPDGLHKDMVNELTVYIDIQNWLQVGSILKDRDRNLLAEYFFRDVRLNPKFRPDLFTRNSM
jgi:hypothetical protein